jgi:hypothetical protein
MCGGTVKDLQKATDQTIKDTQKAADSVINQTKNFIDQNTDTLTQGAGIIPMVDLSKIGPLNLSGSGGGKGAPSYSAPSIDLSSLQPNLDQDLADTPVVKAIEEVAKPAEQVAQTVVKAAEPVVQAAVETATVPFKAVEEVTKIDPVQVTKDLVTEVVKAPEKVIGQVVEPAVSSVADATANTILTATKIPEEISKIDVPKVVENVVTQAATTVTETPKMVVKVAEEAVLKPASAATVYATNELKQAGELVFNNLIDPFQPGETEGTVAEEPVAADLDAKDFGGNEDPFSTIETATTKADKLTEEERLRRIRRLMLNRYGREDTILTGAKDPFNRRRYARSL